MATVNPEFEIMMCLNALERSGRSTQVLNKLNAVTEFVGKVLGQQLHNVEHVEHRPRADILSWLIGRLVDLLKKFEGVGNRKVVSDPAVKIVLNMLVMACASTDSIIQARNNIEGCKTMAFLGDGFDYAIAASESLKLVEKVLDYMTEDEFEQFVEVARRVQKIGDSL